MTLQSFPTSRPIGIAELLDQAILLYRRNFLKFVGIIAIMQVPVALLQLLVSLTSFGSVMEDLQNPAPTANPFEILGPDFWSATLFSYCIALVGFILVQGVGTAALTVAIADDYAGRSFTIFSAYRRIKDVWLPLVITLIIAVLFGLALLIWFLIPCFGWFTGLGITFFYGFVIVPLVSPIVVLEHKRTTDAIRRAWDLARRRFWWILGFALALIAFSQFVVTGPTILATLLLQLIAGSPAFAEDPTLAFNLQTIIQSAVGLIFGLIYLPLQLTCMTLLYFDLRTRTEGLDLAYWAGQVLNEETDIVDITAQAAPAERGNWITWPEMGNFAAVTFGAIGLYFGVVMIFAAFFFFLVLLAGGGNI